VKRAFLPPEPMREGTLVHCSKEEKGKEKEKERKKIASGFLRTDRFEKKGVLERCIILIWRKVRIDPRKITENQQGGGDTSWWAQKRKIMIANVKKWEPPPRIKEPQMKRKKKEDQKKKKKKSPKKGAPIQFPGRERVPINDGVFSVQASRGGQPRDNT